MSKIDDLIASLPTSSEDGITVDAPAFVRKDSPDVIRISAERKDSYLFLDYYGEYRGGCPWINEALNEWANINGGYWEWENPSNIAFYSFVRDETVIRNPYVASNIMAIVRDAEREIEAQKKIILHTIKDRTVPHQWHDEAHQQQLRDTFKQFAQSRNWIPKD